MEDRMAPRAALSAVGLAMVVVAAALCGWASAQQAGCTAMVVNLSPCIGYITSNMSGPPPATCCTQLDNIVQTQMACLCMFLVNGGSPFSIPVNQTQALSLPGACNIKAGPLSQCSNAVGMTPSPAGSSPVAPGPASPATPSPTPPGAIAPSPSGTSPSTMSPPVTPSLITPSGSGSKTVPGGPAVGSSATLRTHPLSFCLLIAVTGYASSVLGF